jgi:GGDEF domain-containing protein
MDALVERLKAEWKRSQPGSPREDSLLNPTVLEILEESVGEAGELGAILRAVRSKVHSGVIDENDFAQISAAIARENTRKRAQEEKTLQPGMLRPRVIKEFIAKEVARARRYGVPFSALSFCLLRAEPNGPSPQGPLTPKALVGAVAQRLSRVLREADIIGQGGKNKLLVLLPMTEEAGAKAALQRSLKVLHSDPIEVTGIQVTVTLTGVAVSFDAARTPGAESFIQTLSEELRNMVFRVTYLHELR